MADYAARYGGPPPPDLPWPMFAALAARALRYDARAELAHWNAVDNALAAAFGSNVAQVRANRITLVAQAYPFRDVAPKIVTNQWGKDAPEA